MAGALLPEEWIGPRRSYSPANPDHVSHSVKEPQGGSTYFDARCHSVSSSILLGHRRIDVPKMNIEGAEHVVLEAILEAGVGPASSADLRGRRGHVESAQLEDRLRGGVSLLGRIGWYFTPVRATVSGA